MDALPDGWVVWNEEDEGQVILAYRPDVFEGETHPPECLPTIYVSQRPPTQRRRRAGQPPSESWYVAFYLEPEVRVRECDAERASRAAALDAAREVAAAFAAGDIDHRGAYQVPRDAYLDALDEVTGTDDPRSADTERDA